MTEDAGLLVLERLGKFPLLGVLTNELFFTETLLFELWLLFEQYEAARSF